MSEETARRIVIDPTTRLEGHGKITIELGEGGEVRSARFHMVEFRGFERFIQGRPYWEVPVVVQRLCGICPVSHLLAASKAMDMVVGVDKLTPTAEKVRRLMHYGQVLQSHALHYYYLACPDLLFGLEAPAEMRNVLAVADAYPELALKGIKIRKFGQEVIRATAGKSIHGTGSIPGGVNKNLSVEERDAFLREVSDVIQWCSEAVQAIKAYTESHSEMMDRFAAFPSNFLSLVRADGALELYDGGLRAKDAEGKIIFDQVDCREYAAFIREEVRPWSYGKFPYIRQLGPEKGWYRVGPLARINNCDFIPTPMAEQERREFMKHGDGKPVNSTMYYHWARLIEMLHAAEAIELLLHDPDLQGTDLVQSGERRSEGFGVIEAPRGTLFHHYTVDEHDLVKSANLIVSTTSNNEPMNRAVALVAGEVIKDTKPDEVLLNRIEIALRAFDPCLSCASHAIGRMPLTVELIDSKGSVLLSLKRSTLPAENVSPAESCALRK